MKQSELGKHRYAEGNPPHGSPDDLLRLYISSLLGSKIVPGYIAWLTRTAFETPQFRSSQWTESPEQANLVRCVFGNPYCPVTFSAEWRTDTAVSLAKQMYASRDFSGMPILADALQDAGCDNEDVLSHCRGATLSHVRGCWVVDLVLNKA